MCNKRARKLPSPVPCISLDCASERTGLERASGDFTVNMKCEQAGTTC